MAHNTLMAPDGSRRFGSRDGQRALARLRFQTQLAMAEVGQVAALQSLRVETVSCVGRRGLYSVALLSQAEQSLSALVPAASSRLQAVADLTTLGIAEVVGDTVRQLTR